MRKRKEDIPLLVQHFIDIQNTKTRKRITGVHESALRLMMDYAWPGNVRELENAIEHAFVLRQHGPIGIMDLPVEIRQFTMAAAPLRDNPASSTPFQVRKKLTPAGLQDLLQSSGWNKAEAARRAGLSRTAVWKKMKQWGIPLEKP